MNYPTMQTWNKVIKAAHKKSFFSLDLLDLIYGWIKSGGNLHSNISTTKRERKTSDFVLWQKPLSLPTENKKKCKVTSQKRHQKLQFQNNCRPIRTVSWSYISHPSFNWTGLRVHNLSTNRKSCVIKRTHIKKCVRNDFKRRYFNIIFVLQVRCETRCSDGEFSLNTSTCS